MEKHWDERNFQKNGHPMTDYKCRQCSAAYVTEERAWDHWRTRHGPRMVAGVVLDAEGRNTRFEEQGGDAPPVLADIRSL